MFLSCFEDWVSGDWVSGGPCGEVGIPAEGSHVQVECRAVRAATPEDPQDHSLTGHGLAGNRLFAIASQQRRQHLSLTFTERLVVGSCLGEARELVCWGASDGRLMLQRWNPP